MSLRDVAPPSYRIYLDSSLGSLPGLEASRSLFSNTSHVVDYAQVVSEFALILSTLRVPGNISVLPGKSRIGCGAQFDVWKQDVCQLSGKGTATVASMNLCQTVAIKTPKFQHGLDVDQKINLADPKVALQVREMILEIAALAHPHLRAHRNIVDLIGWGLSDDTWYDVPFLALELADGDLSEVFGDWKDMPITLKHHICLDISSGLDAIHEVGLVHGDLKPENVLLYHDDETWVARLADFAGANDPTISGFLQGRGTVGWRAPELKRFADMGTALDPSLLHMVDIYSYGLLVWFLFLKENGATLYGESDTASVQAQRDLELHTPKLPLSLHVALKSTLDRTLRLEPRERPASTGKLLDDGSQAYSRWEKTSSTVAPGTPTEYDVLGDEILRYEWEIPEVSSVMADGLKTMFLRNPNHALSPDMLYALSLKYIGHGSRLLWDTATRNLLLQLLSTAAQEGHGPSRSLVNRVYDYFGVDAPLEVQEAKIDWISEGVADGAFYLRRELADLDYNHFEEAVEKFRSRGGYNRFYAPFKLETISELLAQAASDHTSSHGPRERLNERGDSPLHLLASINEPEALSILLDLLQIEDVNRRNDMGETPLYRACMSGVTSNVTKLLSRGADASIVPTIDGPTCLHWVFHFDRLDIDILAWELLRHGSSIDAQCKARSAMLHYPFKLPVGTPLHWATEFSAPEAVHALLRLNANPLIRNGEDPYAYDDSIRYLNMIVPLNSILFSKPDTKTLGLSAMDLAVKHRDPEVLDLILSGLSSGIRGEVDEEGYTALHRLTAGQWQHTLYGSAIWNPLVLGRRELQDERVKDTVHLLKHHGFDLNKLTRPRETSDHQQEFYGQTALMLAVAKGQTDVISALLKAGADVDIANERGRTALLCITSEFAVQVDSVQRLRDDSVQREVLMLLFVANPDIRVRDIKGDTAFLTAAVHQRTVAMELLLAKGAGLYDRVSNHMSSDVGCSALAIAASCKVHNNRVHDKWYASMLKQYMVPLLAGNEGQKARNEILERGDLRGGSLLHYVADHGLADSCAILLAAGAKINPLQRQGEKSRGERNVKIISYYTPLDTALKSMKWNFRLEIGSFSESEMREHLEPYLEISRMLENAGGIQAKTLIAKEYIPIEDS